MIIETVYAVQQWQSMFWTIITFWEFILLAIALFVMIIWIISIVFILWWCILLIILWCKNNKLIIKTIKYATIGLSISMVIIFIFPFLDKQLWSDLSIQNKNLFMRIEEIWYKILWSEIQNFDNVPSDFSDL